jgi:superfamily II DNA/RNA helicase
MGISHIINYDIPDDPHVYVHRIGRTARMGSFGKAMTLVTREQGKQLTEIEKLINREIPHEPVEGFVSRPPPREEGFARTPARDAAPEPAMAATADSSSERKKGLGAKFKPTRRRRRL